MFFKKYYLIKLYCNAAEIINLATGKSIKKQSQENFSSQRQVVADFEKAERFLRKTFKEQIHLDGKNFFNKYIVAFQVMELNEGGLSSVEMRALKDLGGNINASSVLIVNAKNQLPQEQVTNKLILDQLKLS